MNFGESEIVRQKGEIRIVKVGTRHGEAFHVIGKGSTKTYDDYEDALEEFNLRWMKEQFGD